MGSKRTFRPESPEDCDDGDYWDCYQSSGCVVTINFRGTGHDRERKVSHTICGNEQDKKRAHQ